MNALRIIDQKGAERMVKHTAAGAYKKVIICILLACLMMLTACGGSVEASAASIDPSRDHEIEMLQYSDEIQRAESVCPYDGGILISNFGGRDGGYVLYRKDA